MFFPGSQSVYVYNSLADFYTDANDYLANPNRTTSPVTLRRFQVRYNNIPGQEKPIQPLDVLVRRRLRAGRVAASADNLKLTAGLRVDVPIFGDTGYANADADALTFRDENGSPVQYQHRQAARREHPLVAARRLQLGRRRATARTQVRGGTGIFTGRPAYVWISNQIGNTGVLTASTQVDNTTTRPFNPNPNAYKPTQRHRRAGVELRAGADRPGLQVPAGWRTNLAVDQRLPWGMIGTAEFIYNQDVNGIYYINANLPAAQTPSRAPTTARAGHDATASTRNVAERRSS